MQNDAIQWLAKSLPTDTSSPSARRNSRQRTDESPMFANAIAKKSGGQRQSIRANSSANAFPSTFR